MLNRMTDEDRWLKRIENGIERDPRLHAFVIGANER
jgi:hypothetical protein